MDCGGHRGETVRAFRQNYDPQEKVHIISFEPIPENWRYFAGLRNHTLVPYAAWTEDCERPIYRARRGTGEGSSMFPEKTTGDLSPDPTLVMCKDFSAWLRRFRFKPIVKLNIEGAEYPLIYHLAEHHAFKHISLLIVSWHWEKIGISKEVHLAAEKLITCPYRVAGKGYANYGDLSCYI